MRWIALALLGFSLSATMLHAENKVVSMFADVYATTDGKEDLLGSARYTKRTFESMDACDAFRVTQDALDSAERLRLQILEVYGLDARIVLRCSDAE